MSDTTRSPLRVLKASDWRGTHAVAAAPLRPGAPVLLEAAVATTRDAVSEGLPSEQVEWELTHVLLTKGRRQAWAAAYAGGDGGCSASEAVPADDEAAGPWLAKEHGASAADVAAVYETVRHNAFGLETPALGVEYGGAFYEEACRLNHSCNPNCLSVRLGGNMAIFACAPIKAGDELTHSYLPPRLLVLPKRARAAHLHFVCRCARCESEADPHPHPHPESGRGESGKPSPHLGFPPNHAATAAGAAVGRYKVLCAASAGGGSGTLILTEGDRLFSTGSSLPPTASDLVDELRQRPLAALEVALPYLNAYWSLRAHAARLTPDDITALKAGAGRCLPLASGLAAEAAERLTELKAAPAAPLAMLRHSTALAAYLLDGRPRRESVAPMLGAIRGLSAMLGGGYHWLRDDIPFLSPTLEFAGPPLAMPSIATVAEAVAGMDAEGLDGEAYDGGDVGVPPELRLALGHDSCSRPECSAIEASGPAHGPWREGVQIVKFKRCSRCKVYRYCSGECQRKDWSRHKRVCYAAAPNVTPKATPKPPAEATAAPDATAGGPAGGGAAEGHPPQGQGGEARAVERETCGPGWKLTSFQREGAFSQSEELD